MISFTATIKKFENQGEKTGWTFIEIPESIALKLKPGNKKSFRVMGSLDHYNFKHVALLPMGEGNFIFALKTEVRKAIGKRKGAMVKVMIEADDTPFELNALLMDCLADEPEALKNFKKQPGSHQRYFSNWVEAAKTEVTKTMRIAQSVNAMIKGQDYGEMIRTLKKR